MLTLVVNVLLNVSITSVILIQSFYMTKLSRNYFLDGFPLIQFYRLYFILTGLSVIGIGILNYTNYHKLIFLCLIGFFQIIQIFKSSIDEVDSNYDQGDEINNLTESDLLLINSLSRDNAKDSKPVSLLQIDDSVSFKKSSRRSSSKEEVNSKSPILALLLGANGALGDNNQIDFINPWVVSLIILTSLFFLSSQLIYIISIFKTNLYLPARHQYSILTILSIVSIIPIYLLIFTSIQLSDLIINFPMVSSSFNLIIPLIILVQSLVSLLLYHHHSGDLYNTFSTVTIYESMGSPSIMA